MPNFAFGATRFGASCLMAHLTPLVYAPMKPPFLLALVGALTVFGAHAQAKWPLDVARFIERRDGCDHFRGEDPYDEERRKFLQQQTLRLCVGTDNDLATLKKKYRGDNAIMAKLNDYEPQIETAGKK